MVNQENSVSVAVVGGGITGLSCAYELSAGDIEVDVYEKDVMLGGRAPRANQLVTPQYRHFLELVDEIGIKDDALEEVEFSEMAALTGGDVRSFEPFLLFLKPEEELGLFERWVKRPFFSRMMGVDISGAERLKEDLETVEFSYDNVGEEASELHSISAEEWMERYPESIQDNFIYPTLQTMFVDDLSEINAEAAAQHVKEFIKSASGVFREVAGGPVEVTRSIRSETEASFHVGEEVEKVRDHGDTVELRHEGEGELYDYVVLATPLTRSGEMLDEEFGIEYAETEAFTVEGKTEEDFVNLIGADRDTNIRVVFSPGKEKFVYPKDSEEDMDLEKVFKEPEILGSEETVTSPKLPPGKKIPEQEYSDRVLLAGDFYRFPGLETAVYTGRNAAKKIMEKAQPKQ